MIICGVDLETTGLDPKKDKVTEIGAVLWDTELNAPIKFFNKLIKIDIPVPEFIVKLTGITDDLLKNYGEDSQNVLNELTAFASQADFMMAHNAPFDRGFLDVLAVPSPLWIDSSVDIPYPESIQTRKLTHLACEHGFVNPFAHRAMTDVLTMFQVVSKYDWNVIVTNAQTPNVTLQAMVTFDTNHLAKGNGYRWDGTNKRWIKNIKENKVDEETAKCRTIGFNVKKV